jgi:hypothetical protein
MEVLLELLLELGLQVALEIASSSGLRRATDGQRKPPRPWLAALGCACLGGAIGWLSALLFPALFLTTPLARGANVALTPLAAGLVMAGLGRRRARRGQQVGRLERFAYAYLFALGMAVVRLGACQ